MSRTSVLAAGCSLTGILAALCLAGAPPAAADVTIPFTGEVSSVFGNYASFFEGGTRVEGTIVFDESVADTNADPDAGLFPAALVSIEVALPDLAYAWSADDGTLQVFVDAMTGDQFLVNSFVNDPIGNPVNGYPIRTVGFTFFRIGSAGSDALPSSLAGFTLGNLHLSFDDDFGTVVGQATVAFHVPEPGGAAPSAAALAALALAATRRTRCQRRGAAPRA